MPSRCEKCRPSGNGPSGSDTRSFELTSISKRSRRPGLDLELLSIWAQPILSATLRPAPTASVTTSSRTCHSKKNCLMISTNSLQKTARGTKHVEHSVKTTMRTSKAN